MKVRIHEIAHRFGCDLPLDLGDQGCCGGWFGMGIDHEHVGGVVHKNAGITIANRGRTGARKVHSLGNHIPPPPSTTTLSLIM